MKSVIATFALICLSLILAAPVQAKRYALIIGNATYDNLEYLGNTHTDAAAYKDAFEELAFETELLNDLNWSKTWAALDRLIDKIRPGDQVVFVYSGHGWSYNNTNYLIPTDAPESANNRKLARRSIALTNGYDGILDKLEQAGATLRVAIFDACRNNPFAPTAGLRSGATTRGLVPVSVSGGTFVVFSAGAGQTALDGLPDDPPGQNLSVFTRSFLPRLKAGMYLEDAIAEAQLATARLAESYDGHLQHPSYYDETLGKTCLSRGGCGQQASLRLQPEPTRVVQPVPQEQPQQAPQVEAPVAAPQAEPQVEPQQAALRARPQASLRDRMASSTAVRGCDRFGLSPTHPDILLGNTRGNGLSWSELDGARAERLCRAALREFPGHPRLLSSLGRGLNKQSLYAEALSTYQKSARAGDIVAMHNLGVMYQIGQSVGENPMTAAKWYQRSADLGYSYSQFNLGLQYSLGNGVSKDPRRAAEWYLRAAKQGHADAQVWVGHNFQYGQGAAIDPLEAARWYALAQSNGSDTGRARLRQMLQDKPTARKIQQKLKDMGHYSSRVDGSFGRGSLRALKKYCQCRI